MFQRQTVMILQLLIVIIRVNHQVELLTEYNDDDDVKITTTIIKRLHCIPSGHHRWRGGGHRQDFGSRSRMSSTLRRTTHCCAACPLTTVHCTAHHAQDMLTDHHTSHHAPSLPIIPYHCAQLRVELITAFTTLPTDSLFKENHHKYKCTLLYMGRGEYT